MQVMDTFIYSYLCLYSRQSKTKKALSKLKKNRYDGIMIILSVSDRSIDFRLTGISINIS